MISIVEVYQQFRDAARSRRVAARLQRAEDYVKNRPVLHHTIDALWTPEAKWEAVVLLSACKRACKYNHGVVFSGTIAKYRRAK